MQEVEKKTITVMPDQHAAIVAMKRGSDTIYDVVDRLIERDRRIEGLERQFDSLDMCFTLLHNSVKELKYEMMKHEKAKKGTKKTEIYDKEIKKAVDHLIDKSGAVYIGDICEEVGLRKEVVTKWVKEKGFVKPGGHTTSRWVNKDYTSAGSREG